MTDYDIYQSPMSWRYGSPEMRRIWGEANKRRIWRQIWVQLAQVEAEFGLVTTEQVEDLRAFAGQVDMKRALEIEAEIHHDLMAEVKTFAEQAQVGGGIIHLGATSMDIEDNADAIRLRQSCLLLIEKTAHLLKLFAEKIRTWADLPVIAMTHLQPAEPTTLGYRLAIYAQDLLGDYQRLREMSANIRGKGFKGAVGTAASYIELVGPHNFATFEARLSQLLDLPFYPAATQTYPRSQDYHILSVLAGLGATLYKFAFDLRLLQSPMIGEISEPFGSRQVGSSAMPFKRNPIHSEKMDSLARALAQMPVTAWNNAAHSLLERTLDDSANRRSLLPEAMIICDELLITASRVVRGLVVNISSIEHNLAVYAPFASTERLLMALVKAGADRQVMHDRLREQAMLAWEQVRQGQPNPLIENLSNDELLRKYLSPAEILSFAQVRDYLGIAPERASRIASEVEAAVHDQP